MLDEIFLHIKYMMTNKKLITIILSAIIVIGIILISLYVSRPKQITSTPSYPNIEAKPEVTISTDKNEYTKGEIIDIVVKNGLEKDILYTPGGGRIWGIEYYEGNEWKKFGYEGRAGFQLTDENIGKNCYIALYERGLPITLNLRSGLSANWNQKICPFEKESPSKPSIVRNIESGKYRLVFNYGFEISDDDPFRVSEFKTAYSNAFIIK